MAVPRTGIGTDVHASPTACPCTWPGCTCPTSRGGSRATPTRDVAAHAACDALLSAAGLGDLGSNFGTAEPQWAGAAGATLLAETARRVRAAGFEIGNVAVQVIGNRPQDRRRAAPRREAALSRRGRRPVTVSATTTDGLGLTGRGEGVAAVATALVARRLHAACAWPGVTCGHVLASGVGHEGRRARPRRPPARRTPAR